MTTIWMRRLALACLFAAAAPVWAADGPTDAQKLAGIREMSKFSAHPPLTGLNAAQPVPEFKAPAGDHSHDQAWRTAAGCVVFFFVPSEVSEVSVKVTGNIKCNGKPIEGTGELWIKRRVGDQIVLGVMNGTFSAGMLTGQGLKANFVYDKAGKPKESVYVFRGEFANSVLNGQGESRWIGPRTAMPSAWLKQGNFVDGVPRGWVAWVRQHPSEGIEGDVFQLATSPKGNSYVEQAQINQGKLVEGVMFLENDPAPWQVELANWRDGVPVASRFTRRDSAGTLLVASCDQWDFSASRIACQKGQAVDGRIFAIRGVTDAAFTIPLPVRSGTLPFRPAPGTPMMIGSTDMDVPASCSADYSRCRSTKAGILPLSVSLYWSGTMEFRDGGLAAVGAGKLYSGSFDSRPNPSRDTLLASCDDLATISKCESGKVYFDDGGMFAGGWALDGMRFEKDSEGRLGYVVAEASLVEDGKDEDGQKKFKRVSNVHLNPRGWGRMTFSDGSWARVHTDSDGDFDDVDDCDDPKSSKSYTCSLRNGRVMFKAERDPEPVYRAPAQAYQPPAQPAQRFVPQVIPQRQPYMLPGMR